MKLLRHCLTFQSTRPYKPRHCVPKIVGLWGLFQSTRPYKPRQVRNPAVFAEVEFQSTRPYKPRPGPKPGRCRREKFQSTRPYKPRQYSRTDYQSQQYFNPRGRISLDSIIIALSFSLKIFQSTRPYKPRPAAATVITADEYFNPRGRISLDKDLEGFRNFCENFNPRGRISLDRRVPFPISALRIFQSTKPYKPRHCGAAEERVYRHISIHKAV